MKRLIGLLLCCFILSGCSNHSEPVYDKPILVQEGAYTLSDGTVVDLWKTSVLDHAIYQTTEGVELLRIPEQVDIANVHVGGFASFGTLDEPVQEKIRSSYDKNFPELDIPGMLENAWSDYHTSDREEGFSAHYASQYLYPSVSNDRFVVYCVETMIPIEGSNVRFEYSDAIFDRRTGEVIEFWDLFSRSKEEAIEVLARKMDTNGNQFPELKAALENSATARLQQGGIEFCFPLGTLSWSEYDQFMYYSCDELDDILHDWAITEKAE